MFTEKDIRAKYRQLDRIFNISTDSVIIRFSTRSIRQLGACRYVRDTDGRAVPVSITIAEFLKGDPEKFWNTAYHEYAHAAAALMTGESHGHDKLWQSICIKAGGDGIRLAENFKAAEEAAALKAKYKVSCLQCGREFTYFRKTRLISALEKGRKSAGICPFCSGNKFSLTVLQPSPTGSSV